MKPSSGLIWPFNEVVTAWTSKIPGARTWTCHPQLLLLAPKNPDVIVYFFSFLFSCVSSIIMENVKFEFAPCLRTKIR